MKIFTRGATKVEIYTHSKLGHAVHYLETWKQVTREENSAGNRILSQGLPPIFVKLSKLRNQKFTAYKWLVANQYIIIHSYSILPPSFKFDLYVYKSEKRGVWNELIESNKI